MFVAPPLTAMGGLLTRTPDGWRWRDGREEPRVRDLTAAEAFQFPRVFYPDPERPGGRVRWVSIPVRALDEEPDLDELVRGVGAAARKLTGGGVDVVFDHVGQDVFEASLNSASLALVAQGQGFTIMTVQAARSAGQVR